MSEFVVSGRKIACVGGIRVQYHTILVITILVSLLTSGIIYQYRRDAFVKKHNGLGSFARSIGRGIIFVDVEHPDFPKSEIEEWRSINNILNRWSYPLLLFLIVSLIFGPAKR